MRYLQRDETVGELRKKQKWSQLKTFQMQRMREEIQERECLDAQEQGQGSQELHSGTREIQRVQERLSSQES